MMVSSETDFIGDKRRSLHLPILFSFLFLPLAMIVLAYYQPEQVALLSFLAVLISLVPFFVSYERQKLQAHDILPIVVMASLATAGRLIFAAAPNFKPIISILIISAIAFGPVSGFMTGALTALASNIFFGQGPWTAWQMYAFGLVAYLAGWLHEREIFKRPITIYMYAFFSSFLYGIIMDSWHVISLLRPLSWQGALVIYGQGAIFNLILAIASVLFLIPIRKTWLKQLERIKRKYDLSNRQS